MQTSVRSSSMFRMARAAGVMGLAITITGGWVACSPGEPRCEELGEAICKGGSGGGEGGTSGTGGGVMIKAPPASCEPLGVTETTGSLKALDQFETKYIVTKCGTAKCHGPMSVFPPKNMDMPGMIRPTLVGKKSATLCKEDFYVDKTDYRKSFLLHKIEAEGDTLQCPTPGPKPDSGGTRMPNKEGLPGTYGDKLSEGEIECFTWWIEAVGKI